jgi:hypothetical protein
MGKEAVCHGDRPDSIPETLLNTQAGSLIRTQSQDRNNALALSYLFITTAEMPRFFGRFLMKPVIVLAE